MPSDSLLHRCQLRPDVSLETLFTRLSASFEVVRHPAKKQNRTFFDTYVWSLWFDHLVLYKAQSHLILQICEHGWAAGPIIAHIPLKSACPRFVRDFPTSNLREDLNEVIDCRALRQIAEIKSLVQEWDLRDGSSKIVARLRISETHQDDARFSHVELSGLRGYDAEAAPATLILNELSKSDGLGPVAAVLSVSDLQPIPYVLKPELDLAPDQRTRWAVCEAALKALTVVRVNEKGVIEDWDTEFLHDFRVSLRRIRSVLGSIKGIFPEESLESWQQILRTISRQTNQVRDLDVYLLSEDQMTELLPAELRAGLGPFFEQLAVDRAKAFRKLRAYLRSSAYHDAVQFLETAFLHPESLPPTEHSETPIREEASRRISQRFKKLRKLARRVHKEAPDEDIHQVRIAGKKLRYLLEFFGGLFPEDEIEAISNLLSTLQSRLGEFNDTSVQQAYLLKSSLAQADKLDARSAMSLGGLIAALYQEHHFLKREVRRALKKFRAEASIDGIMPSVETEPSSSIQA